MIERWTPKIKSEHCGDGMTLRMWTDKEGDYVLYMDHRKEVEEAYIRGSASHHQKI